MYSVVCVCGVCKVCAVSMWYVMCACSEYVVCGWCVGACAARTIYFHVIKRQGKVEYLCKLFRQSLLALQMLRRSHVRTSESTQQMNNTLLQLCAELVELPQLLHKGSDSLPRPYLVLLTGALSNGLEGGREGGKRMKMVYSRQAAHLAASEVRHLEGLRASGEEWL